VNSQLLKELREACARVNMGDCGRVQLIVA